MANISTNDIAKAIYLASSGKSEAEQSQIFKNTAAFLARKGLLSKTALILKQIKKIINDNEGKMSVSVYAPVMLSENEKKTLSHELGKRYAGKKIEIEEHADPALLGGFKIEAGDELIDLTLKNRIGQLQEFLTTTG
jgi:F-type H+-transporting ATPase subunit delta